MRRWILRAIALMIALPILSLLALWFLAANDQRRYESALLGKTLDEVQAILESKPNRYITREQIHERGLKCGWAAGHEAVGHWDKGPAGYRDLIIVVFDGAGIATEVVFHSAFSDWYRRSFGDL